MIYWKQSVCYETVEMFRTCSLWFQFKTSIFRPSKTFPPSLTMCTCENGNWHMHMQSWRKKGIRLNISLTISQWIQHVFQKRHLSGALSICRFGALLKDDLTVSSDQRPFNSQPSPLQTRAPTTNARSGFRLDFRCWISISIARGNMRCKAVVLSATIVSKIF